MGTKSIAYTYEMGNWTSLDELDPPWQEAVDFDEWAGKAGFKDFWVQAGHPDSDCICISRHESEHRYLVIVSLHFRWDIIIINDFPSLMMFLKEYSPMFQTIAVDYYLHELEEIARKAFGAWHGHLHSNHCAQCDPGEWESSKEWMEKMWQQKRKHT